MVLLLASNQNMKIAAPYKLFFYLQFIVTAGAIWYGVLSMRNFFLSADLRNKVMEISKWIFFV